MLRIAGIAVVGARRRDSAHPLLPRAFPEQKPTNTRDSSPHLLAFGHRGDVDARFGDGFADKVQAALIGMDDPELLATFPREAFIPAANEDFQPIEDTAKQLGLIE